MQTCSITFEQLVDYHEGRSPDAGQLGAHMAAGCDRCAERLSWLSAFLPAMRSALRQPEAVPSPRAVALARGLARTPAPEVHVWIARLVFDGRGGSAAGVRRATTGAFQRLFETDEVSVTVWEERDGGRSYVIGQAYGRADGGPLVPKAVIARTTEGEEQAADIHEREFHFADLSPGVYEVRLRFDPEEVVLAGLEVGSQGL